MAISYIVSNGCGHIDVYCRTEYFGIYHTGSACHWLVPGTVDPNE